jgi:hypothetical protein
MSHESVWYSRPRTYGKGSRSWYVSPVGRYIQTAICLEPEALYKCEELEEPH